MTRTSSRLGTFVALWLAELVSLTGTAMTGFALGVWVYRTTGSAAQFAGIVAVLYLPQVLVTLVGGVLADRYSRRRLILLANAGGAAVLAVLAVLVMADALSVALVYTVTFLVATCAAIQYPAFASSVPQLVPERLLPRANSMVQMATASSRLLAPALAALLIPVVEILGVVLIDLATFAAMVVVLAVIRIPQPAATGQATGVRRIIGDIGAGWAYISRQRGLLILLGFFSVANIAAGFTLALLPPLVLEFGTQGDLGLILSAEGLGWLVGAILMIIWGGPRRRVHGVLGAGIVFGVGIAVLGVRAAVPVVLAGVLVYALALPVINACNATIWQAKVPADMLGRAFAMLRVVALASVPVSALTAGVLADAVFTPLLGEERGIAGLLITVGLLPIVAGVAAYFSRHVRGLDREPAPAAGVGTS
ncbi:MFS transporter [Salinispora sp. H7-4]|uniref:MFS transporter n=1 Tax=Salinispora sp. H7-4 TaxID=2748321 RepID=UPI0015D1E8CF|nr:MFS transporter [Salinispora sp. H7-4]NYT94290.1 MFS transporter [Salinispora sp. H7-4]